MHLYCKRDDFRFPSVNFPCLSNDIPLSLAYGIYVSQRIPFPKACSAYDIFNRGKIQTNKLMLQGCRLNSSYYKSYSRYNGLFFLQIQSVIILNPVSHVY